MSDAKDIDNQTDLDNEQPSTVKSSFQRWLIVSGLLLTLLFIFIFLKMTTAEKEKELEAAEAQPDVPEQVQEGSLENKNSAIDRFQKQISKDTRETASYGERMDTEGNINRDFAPRKTRSFEAIEKDKNRKKLEALTSKPKELSNYEKFLKSEEVRAYQSYTSKDTIGDASGFYGEPVKSDQSNNNQKPLSVPRESIAQKQARIQEQIKQVSEYRKKIESGELDASSPPPGLLKMLEQNKP